MKTVNLIFSHAMLLLSLIGSTHLAVGQVTAGIVPSGAGIIYDVADLRAGGTLRDTTTDLDIDGNGNHDIRLSLRVGAPVVDDPHRAKIIMLHDEFSFCADTFADWNTHLYELGDEICTAGDQQWGTVPHYTVGCYGGKECGNIFEVTETYVGYRKNSTGEIGWMKIYYYLKLGPSPDSIIFTVSEVLTPYIHTGTDDVAPTLDVQLIPNPTFNGRCFIQSSEPIVSFAIFDTQGQLMHHDSSGSHTISLPDQPGLFFISIQYKKGRSVMSKVIRL